MDSGKVTVFLYNKPEEPFQIQLTSQSIITAEDLCHKVAKSLCLRPITFHLFSLRVKNHPELWLPSCTKLDGGDQSNSLEFRLRFKLPLLTNLSRLDENAFNYLFHQMRNDLLYNRICELDKESEVLGLCIMDMSRVIEENQLSQENVETNYRQFIPKEIWNRHLFFLKKKIQQHLRLFREIPRTVEYIKEIYVSRIEDLVPNYLEEQYYSMMYKEEEYPATIRVNPFHSQQPGIAISYIGKHNWEQLCSIEELCFISMRTECTAEISRKNGIPISFQFKNDQQLKSFISLLDGYYRLSEKWTFNLCNDFPSPFLIKLRMLKSHGPVGEKFSQTKLSNHPAAKKGSYILRQSSCTLGNYALDFILEHKNRPFSKEIELVDEDKFMLEGSTTKFSSVPELISFYITNPTEDITLRECIPPSDYDRSPLLLCRPLKTEDTSMKLEESSSVPHVISARSLQVYRNKKHIYQGKTCNVMKALWYTNKGKTETVALKFLKDQNDEKLTKDFLEMADRCVGWQCESLVNLRGIVLGNPQALVFSWLQLGPLDIYLQENNLHVGLVELLEAASDIAKAVWFLEDHLIVHGNVRCHNVLVAEQTDSGFLVKLSDPSILQYKPEDLHWIPPEFMEIPLLASKFSTTDVWALGTTLWEVFSYGTKPSEEVTPETYKQKYTTGWRLPRPDRCPGEIHRIIAECWSQNSDTRKQPQAIVRDIHQILYQFIGTKRAHTYASVSCSDKSNYNDGFDPSDNVNWSTFGSEPSPPAVFGSNGTQTTFINDLHSGSTQSHTTQTTWLFNEAAATSPDIISNFAAVYNGSIGTVYSVSSARGIYEFGKNQLTLGRLIGEGCYGAVYFGELKRTDGSLEPVAVKKMKDLENMPDKEELDLQREFDILQKLYHQNIVEVKGVMYDPSVLLVMEYLPIGSLLDHFAMSHTKPSQRQLMKFAQDVAEGMEYLSDNSIVHRDLAARNLLVATDDLVKISDFGLARITDTDNCYTYRTNRKLPIKWYPPECLEQGKFSEFSDVWSFGVTLFEIFSYGQDPILPGTTEQIDIDNLLNALKKGFRLSCPETCPQIVYTQLMLPCWKENPNDRPTFKKLVGIVREIETNLF